MGKVKQKILGHLIKAKKGYFEHMAGAVKTSGECFLAGLTALIHGFLPFLFETTASDLVRNMYKRQN